MQECPICLGSGKYKSKEQLMLKDTNKTNKENLSVANRNNNSGF